MKLLKGCAWRMGYILSFCLICNCKLTDYHREFLHEMNKRYSMPSQLIQASLGGGGVTILP